MRFMQYGICQIFSLGDNKMTTNGFDTLLGNSRQITGLKKELARISQSDEPILIEGESGTGKTMIASLLHENSRRRGNPFFSVNSAAIAENLAEGELMGSVPGGFTDARNRPGYFELANGGTLFLDEVSELSTVVQAKLLTLCEGNILYRVGSINPIKYDVRLMCATNAKMSDCLRKKLFRTDLYYRISVLRIKVPPLREHIEDIPILIEHFLKSNPEYKNYYFAPDAIEKMLAHNWPGNVRELKNCVYRAVSLCNGELVQPEDIIFDQL